MRRARKRLPFAWRVGLFVTMMIVGAVVGTIVHQHRAARKLLEQKQAEEATREPTGSTTPADDRASHATDNDGNKGE